MRILCFLLFFASCNSNVKKQKIDYSKIDNVEQLYEIVDSISNSEDKFSDENIKIMGKLYDNKVIKELIKRDAYGGLDSYFTQLFLNNDKQFYKYLNEKNRTLIYRKIKDIIQQDLIIREDVTEDFVFRDSLMKIHLKNNEAYKLLVKDIMNR